jgi:hypothetical protein
LAGGAVWSKGWRLASGAIVFPGQVSAGRFIGGETTGVLCL